MIQFYKKGNMFWVNYVNTHETIRLGLVFAETTENGKPAPPEIEVLEIDEDSYHPPRAQRSREELIRLVKKEKVVSQVKDAVRSVNKERQSNYKVLKISYPRLGYTRYSSNMYQLLASMILRRYHNQEEFPEETKEEE